MPAPTPPTWRTASACRMTRSSPTRSGKGAREDRSLPARENIEDKEPAAQADRHAFVPAQPPRNRRHKQETRHGGHAGAEGINDEVARGALRQRHRPLIPRRGSYFTFARKNISLYQTSARMACPSLTKSKIERVFALQRGYCFRAVCLDCAFWQRLCSAHGN